MIGMTSEKKQSYGTRLFAGRMNRQNYIIGSTVLVLPSTILFLIVLFNVFYSVTTMELPSLDTTNLGKMMLPQQSLQSIVLTPTNEWLTLAGVCLLVLTLPYLLSMQIRRQHDLNLPGWLWIINLLSFVSFYTYFPSANAGPGTTNWWILNCLSVASSLFSLYCTLWPGSKGTNKYGEPTIARTSIKNDVLALA